MKLENEIMFYHETQPNYGIILHAECEYVVGDCLKYDTCTVIGEVTNEDGEIVEVSNRELKSEFYHKFKDEIEDARIEVLAEHTSRLKDF